MRFSELEGASVGVWGAGREIRSFAAQLGRRLPSARISVVAAETPVGAGVLGELGAADAVSVGGGRAGVEALAGCDVVVRSPGVSIYRAELVELRERGIRVTTATALWLGERGGAGVIGVTGTKGKSTTAALIVHLVRAGGRAAELAGNIGVPALDLLDRPAGEAAVIELSSYQTADLEVGPEVAVATNLYREHVDWHGSHEAYRADKLRLFGLPGVRISVVNGRDRELVAAVAAAPEPRFYGVPEGWDVTGEGIAVGGRLVLASGDLPLRGEHNALNLCAAVCAVSAWGIELGELGPAVAGFAPLRHRLEIVGEWEGVVWVDDSISTTPESTLAAMASFGDRSVVLVGGGQDRGQDYEAVGRELARRGAAVIGLPVTGGRLVEAARRAGVGEGRAVAAGDMEEAVRVARGLAVRGTAVILSPAAPSYHAYRDFEERGDHFRDLAEGA